MHWHGIIYFYTRGLYLQGLLNNINEQDTLFLDCKHKLMMKSGAPTDKVSSPKGYHYLVPDLISIFRDCMGHFKKHAIFDR